MTIQTILAENVDFETYLREYEGQYVEYDDGRVIALSPSNALHDFMVRFLEVFFDSYLSESKEGQIHSESLPMRLVVEGKTRGPIPDILVVLNKNIDKLYSTYVDGPADLVIEVVSPESDVRDRMTKLALYQQAGVPEYWIIDPVYREALFYVLGEDKQYHRQRPNEQGVYQSAVLPRFKIEVMLLFRDPIPNAREAVRLADELLKEQ